MRSYFAELDEADAKFFPEGLPEADLKHTSAILVIDAVPDDPEVLSVMMHSSTLSKRLTLELRKSQKS